ncbi:TPA: hypothetical protein DDZ86_01110 [Candidatus Dependentiae bacterium]|nr:hypothetical protein [Candidatus Dependentiae bacterium]
MNELKKAFTYLGLLTVLISSYHCSAAHHCFKETSKKVFSKDVTEIAKHFSNIENTWAKYAPVQPAETIDLSAKSNF